MKGGVICLKINISSRHLTAFVILILMLFSLSSCKDTKLKSETSFEWFDTVTTVSAYMSESDFENMWDTVCERFDYYNKLFDIYDEYDGINNLCTVNKNAGKAPVTVDKELVDFISYAKTVYDITSGKVNIAMGSVLKIWHDYREAGISFPEKAELPPESLLDEKALNCDINKVIVDTENNEKRTVFDSAFFG